MNSIFVEYRGAYYGAVRVNLVWALVEACDVLGPVESLYFSEIVLAWKMVLVSVGSVVGFDVDSGGVG